MSSFYWSLNNCFSVSNHPSLFHSSCWGWDSFPQTSFPLYQLLPVRPCPLVGTRSDCKAAGGRGDVKLLVFFPMLVSISSATLLSPGGSSSFQLAVEVCIPVAMVSQPCSFLTLTEPMVLPSSDPGPAGQHSLPGDPHPSSAGPLLPSSEF